MPRLNIKFVGTCVFENFGFEYLMPETSDCDAIKRVGCKTVITGVFRYTSFMYVSVCVCVCECECEIRARIGLLNPRR